jgi:tRNA 2-thiouridine synthesizing protein A
MSTDDPIGGRAAAMVVDARGLEPPEPMVRVMNALDELPRGERLLMLIHIEPRPLFRVLERNQFAYRCELQPEGHFEVTIWHRK